MKEPGLDRTIAEIDAAFIFLGEFGPISFPPNHYLVTLAVGRWADGQCDGACFGPVITKRRAMCFPVIEIPIGGRPQRHRRSSAHWLRKNGNQDRRKSEKPDRHDATLPPNELAQPSSKLRKIQRPQPNSSLRRSRLSGG